MKKLNYIVFALISVFICTSCGNNETRSEIGNKHFASDYVDAVYEYTEVFNDKTCRIQVALSTNGEAYMKLLDKPITKDLRDLQELPSLYYDGQLGYYHTTKGKYFQIIPNREVWYSRHDEYTHPQITAIYLSNDGYVYYDREYLRQSCSGVEDMETGKYRGSRYIRK